MRISLCGLALFACANLCGAEMYFDSAAGIGTLTPSPGRLTVTGPVEDWSKYDYLVFDFINNSFASPEDSLWITACSAARPDSRRTVPCHYPVSFSTNRYWMPLSDWDAAARSKISGLSICRKKISPDNLVPGRVQLLARGEVPADAGWTDEDMREVVRSNLMFRAGSEARRRVALAGFRRDCRAAGQDVRRCVGEARSSEQVRPRSAFSARPARRFSVRMARNEYESFQVLVLPVEDEKRVRVRVSDLRCGNHRFPASDISVSVMGYVETKSFPPNKVMGEGGREEFPEMGWYPDPILDGCDSCPVAKDDVQSFWVRVYCPADRKPGRYEGSVTVDFGDETRNFPLTVRVNAFTLPRHPPCRLAVSFRPCFSPPIGSDPEYVKMCNWKKWNPLRWADGAPLGYAHRRRDDWVRFLAGYSITYDSLYHCETNLPWEVFSELKREGRLGFFNLGVWGENPRFKDSFMRTISANYAEAEKRGLLAHAYIYGFDETPKSRFGAISNAIAEIKAAFPKVPFLTTAFDPSLGLDEPALGAIDWFTPSITTNCYDLPRVKASREAGHKVWWYTCCFPHAPYPQLFLDAPPVETRLLLGAMAAKFRPDGFLYYQSAIWNTDSVISQGPFTSWPADSYYCYHGDGSLTRVGKDGRPLATQRLENFRDGLEDLWYVRLLRRRKAEIPVPEELVRSTADFSRDASLLERWRDAMADRLDF